MEKEKKAYKKILNLMNKHKDLIFFDIDALEFQAKNHLFGVELKEKYGLDINPKDVNRLDWIKFGEYRTIAWFGDKYNRTISWSDDRRQPLDELLLLISFPTGAYIFGNDYPYKLFQTFFDELKSFNPEYIDTNNKSLYFKIENAKDVFNSFNGILGKYWERNKADITKRKIDKMKAELKELEAKSSAQSA